MTDVSYHAVGPISATPSGFEARNGLLADLADMLRQSNGFVMWDGAFVLLPSGDGGPVPGIEGFNAGEWKRAYPKEVEDTVFFAVDAFGFPFGVSHDRVVQLDPETGILRPVAETLGGLLDKVRAEPDETVALFALERWRAAGRDLRLGQRLAPKTPFVLGGGREADDFYAADMMERAAFNAHVYGRIRNLPDGATVELKVVP